MRLCLSVPWEQMAVPEHTPSPAKPKAAPAAPQAVKYPSLSPATPALPAKYSPTSPVKRGPPPPIERPGCTAADNALLVHSYLSNLADGKPGFGVLRIGKERLEEGAKAAAHLGHPEIAAEMTAIAVELPNVRDPEAARMAAEKLKPVVDAAWGLGQTCKGGLSPEQLARVRSLAKDVKTGKLTLNEAVAQVQGDE